MFSAQGPSRYRVLVCDVRIQGPGLQITNWPVQLLMHSSHISEYHHHHDSDHHISEYRHHHLHHDSDYHTTQACTIGMIIIIL